LISATLGPRLTGLNASRAPAARWRRQSESAEEYSPSRRMIALARNAQLVPRRERTPAWAIPELRRSRKRLSVVDKGATCKTPERVGWRANERI
jgi:hypothetical protein